MEIKVSDITGENAVAMDDGEKLYKLIHDPVKAGNSVFLDFQGINIFASPFFNASIGHLLEDIPLEDVKKNLKYKDIDNYWLEVIELVIANSNRYYNDPSYQTSLDAVLEEGEDA